MASATDARYAIPGFISILVVLGIFAVGNKTFEPLRPSAEEQIDYSESTYTRVEARLWQDPFNAIEAYDESLRGANAEKFAVIAMLRERVSRLGNQGIGETGNRKAAVLPGEERARLELLAQLLACLEGSTASEVIATGKFKCSGITDNGDIFLGDYKSTILQSQLEAELRTLIRANGRVFLLPVALPVGDYADLIERRRRSRYAVVSALTQQGFLPNDGEHLRVLRAPNSVCSDDGSTCQSNPAPYEYFSREATDPDGNPTNLVAMVLWIEDRNLHQSLLPLVRGVRGAIGEEAGIQSYLLGPYSSANLPKDPRPTGDIEVINWSATNRSQQATPAWTHTISTDTELLTALAQKVDTRVRGARAAGMYSTQSCDLENAQSTPSAKGKTVLLISEGDTGYATSLYQFVKRCFSQRGYEVLARSYIRGIDGQYPGHTPRMPGASEAQGGESLTASLLASGFAENSAGTSQFDYLRRLAKRLGDERQRIDAVGVLGSDPYDKVLVLQALRSEYPNAVYFTTDLYSLFLREDSDRIYQNLLVAASHDLRVGDGSRRSGAPLRDSYQSSLYEAVVLASAAAIDGGNTALHKHVPRVRLFEIGRGNVFELRAPATGGNTASKTATAISQWRASFAVVNLLAVFYVGFVACFQIRVYRHAQGGSTLVREDLARRSLPVAAWLTGGAIIVLAALWKFTSLLGSRPIWDFAPDTGEQTMALATLLLSCAACLAFVALRPAEMLADSKDPSGAALSKESDQRDTQLRALISLTILVCFVIGYLIIWALPVLVGAQVGELWSLTAGVSAWPPLAFAIIIILLCAASYGFINKRREFLATDLHTLFDLGTVRGSTDDPDVLDTLKRFHTYLTDGNKEGPFDLRSYPIYVALLVFVFVLISIVENDGMMMFSLSFRGGANMMDLPQLIIVLSVSLFSVGLFLVGRESRKILDSVRSQANQNAEVRVQRDAELLQKYAAMDGESKGSDFDLTEDCLLTRHAKAFFENKQDAKTAFRYLRFPNSVRNSLADIELVELITMQIQRLFYLPVMLLVLFAAAALPLFDAWPVSRPVLIFGGVVTTGLVLQAWRLDYTARQVQRNLLEVLAARHASIEHMAIDATHKERVLQTLSYASHTIRSEHEGAFLPLSALPLVRILIVTVGALGLILSQAIFGIGYSL